jgi:dihydroorotase/N-acyl-D-amino-acid deacylase
VLGHYARDEGVLELEDAVRKMTSSVATRLGIRDRGVVAPGMHADLVVFDPARVRDTATFADSHRLAEGVRDVWVNGVATVRGGEHTGALAGRFVRGPGARRRSARSGSRG